MSLLAGLMSIVPVKLSISITVIPFALNVFDIFSSTNYTIPGIQAAFERGGVITVSWHAPNFVTGGSFYDTTGDVVTKILPGGSHHTNFTAILDDIAYNLGNLEYMGEDIPIIFRPWHEFNGNWFWWGSSYCSKQDFKNLFRFTVEYLRDVKGSTGRYPFLRR